jgi:hypothetical protein
MDEANRTGYEPARIEVEELSDAEMIRRFNPHEGQRRILESSGRLVIGCTPLISGDWMFEHLYPQTQCARRHRRAVKRARRLNADD